MGVDISANLFVGTSDEILAAADAAVAEAYERLRGWRQLAEADVEAALDAYDEAVAVLTNVRAAAKAIRAVHPEPASRAVATLAEERVAAALTAIELDADVLSALAFLRDRVFDEGTRWWIGQTVRRARAAGADRDEAFRSRIAELRSTIRGLEQGFEKAIADDRLSLRLSPEVLAGLPEEYIAAHPIGDDGRIEVSTDRPDVMPFLAHARDEAARAEVWRLSRRRAQDNDGRLRELLTARHELAAHLGLRSWAHLVLDDTMVKTPEAVHELLDRIAETTRHAAKREYADLLALKRQDDPGAAEIWPWDIAFLLERARRARTVDAPAVRRFFDLARVLEDLGELVEELFEIRLQPVAAAVWHPDVLAYDVVAEGSVLGRIFMDLRSRPGKAKGASMHEIVAGKAGRRQPQCLVSANLSAANGEAVQLSFADLVVVLHEVGHALHHVLAGGGRWSATSGLTMEWDFVEVPSLVLEEWARDPRTVSRLGRDPVTGEPLDSQTARRLAGGDGIGRAMTVAQQAFYAQLSLDLHLEEPGRLDPVRVEETALLRQTMLLPVPGAVHYLTFGHLAGYSATYYTYLWSQVIAKDIYAAIRAGTPQLGFRRFRDMVLRPGGSAPMTSLVEGFLGRGISFDAFTRWMAGD